MNFLEASQPSTNLAAQTRERLLEAAREVFAQHGMQRTTVREICRIAKTNIASVNYYFGSKDELLAEALNFNQLSAMLKANEQSGQNPEQRLKQFVRDYMMLILDERELDRQTRMMARELVQPTPVLDKIVCKALAPMYEFLFRLLRELAGDQATDEQVMLCVYSLLGQCQYYRLYKPVLQRLNHDMRYDRNEILTFADHISQFTLRALQNTGG